MDLVKFNEIKDIKEIIVTPKGWKEIIIEYGISTFGNSNILQFYWRVKNTSLIFESPLAQVYEDCKGQYEEHFSKVLEMFRKDYISWKSQGFPEPWMRKRQEQFGKYIYTYTY